eukprot:122455_1
MSRTAIMIACICLYHLLGVQSIVIDTKLGKIEGIEDTFGTYVFHNIRYAEPPIDDLRWKPPQPLKETWNGVYNATSPGNACHQPALMSAVLANGSNGVLSEDCLTLAIQTPYQFTQSETQSLRPVLFFIHGGAFTGGSGYSFVSSNLAKNEDIVVVGFNYRLGVAAWLLDPELHDHKFGNGGSNGLLDMLEALKWVKKNIVSYGGDPNEITVAGESAGGIMTCALLLSPLAKGLFKRSIQMSGSCVYSFGKPFSQQEGWALTQLVRDTNNATIFDELRTMDMQNMTEAFAATMKSILPATDGYFFPMSTKELLHHGLANGESTMIGTVFRESFTEKPFNMPGAVKNLSQLNERYYEKLFDTQAKLFQKYYPEKEVKTKVWPYGVSEFDDNIGSLIQTVQATDCWVRCGSLWQADILAAHPVTKNTLPVYFYQYGYITKPWDQVSHGYDMIGLFGWDTEWLSAGVPFSEEFVKITQNFFGNYIRNGAVVTENGDVASIQNGYYVQITDGANVVTDDDLDVVRDRCEVYKILGDEIWRDQFCTGIYPEDFSAQAMDDLAEKFSNDTESETDVKHEI